MLISEALREMQPVTQRKIYALFQQAVKRGELPALRLLTRFEVQGAKGQTRRVFDYAYTQQSAEQISHWIAQQQAAPRVGGVTAEQVQQMTDDELNALIAAQNKAKRRKYNKRKAAATTDNQTAESEQQTEQQHHE